jgi:CO/xanthine dehydrogenase Mo-binding subunit
MLRDGAGIGGDLASRASADRRIRKLSLDSILSGRPELHCEAHVTGPAPRSLRSDRTIPAVDVAVVQVKAARRSAGNFARVFRDPAPDTPPAGPAMLLEGLQAGIAGQLAVLDDARLTGEGCRWKVCRRG